MKNKIEDLRNHLFETLEALKDSEKPMELDRARAIAEVGKVIVESAKVEVSYVRAIGATKGTTFMGEVEKPALPDKPGQPRLVKGSASE